MNDRAFRLDFFVAIAAMLISAITAGTIIYQTRVIGDQFSATIWPYLSVGTTYDRTGEIIQVTNDGMGPALVRSAELHVDGKAVRAWNDYIQVLVSDPKFRIFLVRTRAAVLAGGARSATISMSSIGASSTLRPGDSKTLLKIALPVSVPMQMMARHPLEIDLCYCSLNGSCWKQRSSPGQITPDPQPVSHCASAAAIESNPLMPSIPRSTPGIRGPSS